MSNHTKGPWGVLPDIDFYIRRIFAGSHYIGVIGNSDDTIDVTIANARLIAAAPDLLDVLCEMVAMMDCGDEHGAGSDWHKKAKVVIAKAKGEL